MVMPRRGTQSDRSKGLSSTTPALWRSPSICEPNGIWKKARRKNQRKQSMKKKTKIFAIRCVSCAAAVRWFSNRLSEAATRDQTTQLSSSSEMPHTVLQPRLSSRLSATEKSVDWMQKKAAYSIAIMQTIITTCAAITRPVTRYLASRRCCG